MIHQLVDKDFKLHQSLMPQESFSSQHLGSDANVSVIALDNVVSLSSARFHLWEHLEPRVLLFLIKIHESSLDESSLRNGEASVLSLAKNSNFF